MGTFLLLVVVAIWLASRTSRLSERLDSVERRLLATLDAVKELQAAARAKPEGLARGAASVTHRREEPSQPPVAAPEPAPEPPTVSIHANRSVPHIPASEHPAPRQIHVERELPVQHAPVVETSTADPEP